MSLGENCSGALAQCGAQSEVTFNRVVIDAQVYFRMRLHDSQGPVRGPCRRTSGKRFATSGRRPSLVPRRPIVRRAGPTLLGTRPLCRMRSVEAECRYQRRAEEVFLEGRMRATNGHDSNSWLCPCDYGAGRARGQAGRQLAQGYEFAVPLARCRHVAAKRPVRPLALPDVGNPRNPLSLRRWMGLRLRRFRLCWLGRAHGKSED